MKNFDEFGLSEDVMKSLSFMKYAEPTPIQAMAIPVVLSGRDVLGSAQTGTGKTAAFSIPIVEQLIRNPDAHALILTPTRELARQVLDVVRQLLGPRSKIKTAFIIGGEPMGKQMSQLRQNPRIIVGTPGRINDHLDRKSLKLAKTNFLVLDETDRMLDMGFGVQLDRIAKHLPEERQTLMFSATLPKGIIDISKKYLQNPERISFGETNTLAKNITQDVLRIEQSDKYKELVLQLHERDGSVIVFVKTKHGADKMAKKLREDGFTSEALHGDLRQNKRDKVMKNFRVQNFRVMIATDIAARGLDVPHIEHVINYDLPQVAEDYIHRMGRTARAGAKGSAISFVSQQDGRKWHAIECLLDPELAERKAFDKKKKNSKHRKRPFKGKSNGPNRGAPQHGESKPKHAQKSRKPKAAQGQNRNAPRHGEDKAKRGYKGGKPKSAKGQNHGKPGDSNKKYFKKRQTRKKAA